MVKNPKEYMIGDPEDGKDSKNVFVRSARLTRQYISQNRQFTLEQICKYIKDHNGIPRALPNCPTKEYLDSFEEKGILFYHAIAKTYFNLPKIVEDLEWNVFSIPLLWRKNVLQELLTREFIDDKKYNELLNKPLKYQTKFSN